MIWYDKILSTALIPDSLFPLKYAKIKVLPLRIVNICVLSQLKTYYVHYLIIQVGHG